MRRFGIDLNAVMTPDGKFQTPDGLSCESSSSESSDGSGAETTRRLYFINNLKPTVRSLNESSDHIAYSKRKIEKLQYLRLRLRARCKKKA